MHQFLDGEWVTEYEATNEDGEFERQTTTFRDRVDPEEATAGRYHLYVSYACPWAHRTLIARRLLGLEDVISVDVVDPYRAADGWQFSPEKDGCTPDTVNGFDYLREAYVAADPNYTGRVTVPVLWDTVEDTIVNNESREILRNLTTVFADLGNGVDLSPEGLRDDIDDALDRIYEPINNGVYRTGFADSQAAYDDAVAELFDALDYWNSVLEDQRYLVGDRLTEADIAMYTTLVRFDEVYHTHFMCNRRLIREYDTLWPYLRDLYTTLGFGETTRMDHIKEHYYTTHPDVSPKRIIPAGPAPDFEAPHDRDELAGEPPV
ncbi:YqjG-type gamma-glutamylcysteinyl-hydroquinone reductase [Natronomonas pharaonis DSM 2160]|uniref:YqjG-type gamma-glutamylcysteinyl-hydroquinone reductase n=1 Tax=Natronomonas pharaonis (strain ATCC 35678 / DSM 2160 / CIP 103997 / JCM 8858 / NBRC 14720 / NCIMB 2260 / Gabara) TaxID=348780 RepID=A0A1U7EZ97_NATPD|nr:glutathione S-transferase family protein [Natronomonas pharaonis]CAI50615.1 YqjG-type gamma-glutamylcysteinyl-hydroquinone reductase [Natronomonas pharaonis DSM 2160]